MPICRIERLPALLLLCALSVWMSQALAAGPVCRVSVSGSGDGSSWSQTMALQTALADAGCTELWVARGTYTPTTAATPGLVDRIISFSVRPGVAVYGGFAGNEMQLSQRDFTANRAILSGDIGIVGNVADNTFQVVSMDGTTGAGTITASTKLDGFTIRDGNANHNLYPGGGGLICRGNGAGSECSPLLTNLSIIQNRGLRGGGMYNNGSVGGKSSPTLSNVTFSGNFAALDGGGMYNDGRNGISSPILGNVTFSGNSGGNPVSTGNGGAMFNEGESGGNASPRLVNVTISGNSAGSYGGAIYNSGGFTGDLGTSSPTLINVIVWNNPAMIEAGIYNYFQSTTTISYSMIQGGCPAGGTCTNMVSGDPLLAALADNGGSMQTMAAAANSPAKDAGRDSDCGLSPVSGKDQRGVLRPQGLRCDIGAVEYFPGNYVFGNFIFSNGFENLP